MLAALTRTIAQIGDPAFRGVLLRALGTSLAVFVVLWMGAWFGLAWLSDLLAAWIAGQDVGGFWRDLLTWLFDAAAIAGLILASFLFFPAVVAIAISLFLDEIADAVEERHSPHLPAPRSQPWGEIAVDTLVFALVTIGANLLALPLYLLLLFVPPLNLFVYYGLNGYLLGREYFEMVAVRRLQSADAKRLRRRNRGRVFLAGVIIAFILSIPLVNLVAPIVATGFLVHLFHGLMRGPETSPQPAQ
ncbi:MAG: EI24 domain-containing protein [Kiloniellales bacterium]